jgi:hypothetical protein
VYAHSLICISYSTYIVIFVISSTEFWGWGGMEYKHYLRDNARMSKNMGGGELSTESATNIRGRTYLRNVKNFKNKIKKLKE